MLLIILCQPVAQNDFGNHSLHKAELPGGAKVLGKLSVPGRPNNLDNM